MPSRPKATKPKANTDWLVMKSPRPCCDIRNAMKSSTASVSAFQNTEKLPATRPDRMFSEAPPSLEAATTSWTWRECELVKTLVNSGMRAAARVPHEMIVLSFHHRPPGKAASGSSHFEAP